MLKKTNKHRKSCHIETKAKNKQSLKKQTRTFVVLHEIVLNSWTNMLFKLKKKVTLVSSAIMLGRFFFTANSGAQFSYAASDSFLSRAV